MTTTAVHEKVPAQKRSVATIMNHDVRTAERDYLLQEKKKKVAATGAFVWEVIRNVEVRQISDEESVERIGEEKVNTESVRKLKSENPELDGFSEKQLLDKICCFILFYELYPNRIPSIFEKYYLSERTFMQNFKCLMFFPETLQA